MVEIHDCVDCVCIQVIYVSLSPKCVASSVPYPLLMNVGDPSRKNTLTVEITPLTNQVYTYYIITLCPPSNQVQESPSRCTHSVEVHIYIFTVELNLQ